MFNPVCFPCLFVCLFLVIAFSYSDKTGAILVCLRTDTIGLIRNLLSFYDKQKNKPQMYRVGIY